MLLVQASLRQRSENARNIVRERRQLMGNLGVTEIVLIVLVIILLFGAKKIPELASGLGKGLKEFKKAQREADIDTSAESKKVDPEKKS